MKEIRTKFSKYQPSINYKVHINSYHKITLYQNCYIFRGKQETFYQNLS